MFTDLLLVLIYVYILMIHDYYDSHLSNKVIIDQEDVDQFNYYGTLVIYFMLIFHAIHLFKFLANIILILFKFYKKKQVMLANNQGNREVDQ